MSKVIPQLQNKLIIVMQNEIRCSFSSDNMQRFELRTMPPNLTEMIGMHRSHFKITAATTTVLFWRFFG